MKRTVPEMECEKEVELSLDNLVECSMEKKKLKYAAYNGFVLLCNDKEEYAGSVKCTTCL